jgi:uncharacterized repeat protein (TIGR03803 family)
MKKKSSHSLLCRLIFAGVLVAIVPSAAYAGQYKTLYTFKGPTADGRNPYGQLIFDHAGNLYGVTGSGGSGSGCNAGCGIAFELSTTNGRWKERVLYNFSTSNTEGISPAGPLLLDAKGNLYGTTNGGGDPVCQCGEVYQLTRTGATWTQNVLLTFVNGNNGQDPIPGLLMDEAGNIYGAAGGNGAGIVTGCDCGTIFELSPNSGGTWTETVIYQFTFGRDGAFPSGPLTMDSVGNIYGATNSGGVYGFGTIFKLALSNGAWTETTLYDFTIAEYGGPPNLYGLILDQAGNLYGASQSGGENQVGEIYEFSPASAGYWIRSTIYTFTGQSDGGYPVGGLTIDKSGNLYGTTTYGGQYQYGTVFKLTPGKNEQWKETVLHSFSNGTDGSFSYGITIDPTGNLYGAAQLGGTYNDGVVYEITP